uniref:Zinc finger, CCHC-type n=1 Tax=Tanacetum cinerariifolium TaxID=118510 RepID=A0A6L2M788_TANCI|nr:zinc finger, CCHC-type [Tanacetum cinerariifolium]
MWCLFDLTPSDWCKTDVHSMDSGKERELCLSQFSLHDQARNWLEHLPAGSIFTWEDLTTCFLAQFFPPRRTTKVKNDILMFQQHHGESLFEAWTHFKDLLQKVPHHGIDLWLQVRIFYDHVNQTTRHAIDHSTGGKLRDKSTEESWKVIENLALYDHESWNDPSQGNLFASIWRKFIANAYIDLDLPMNVMSLAYYNAIRNKGYEHRGLNFVRNGKDMHVFVWNWRSLDLQEYVVAHDGGLCRVQGETVVKGDNGGDCGGEVLEYGRYDVPKVLDTVYRGFLGVGTTFDIF